MTLIAEDLLLLLLDDESGKPQTQHLEIALGGAVLVELALQGMVEVAASGPCWRSAKLRPVQGARPDDPVLTALGDVGENQAAQKLVGSSARG